ncbi:hypothetical protein NZL82_01670 [Sphingomonas sanguinis]|uniref:hypothetical protein n=1 Tax=Sphingomonas sp. LC-1 TaxID=3110957 RepID=UPI0021BA5218|nr:hypothetical protein [Sphingomonas sp. LC-1]MCT8000580.1 hypothetical protein [Sphingomonas sp. LC-1]
MIRQLTVADLVKASLAMGIHRATRAPGTTPRYMLSAGYPPIKQMALPAPFKAGDLVTRDGTDLQRVVRVNPFGDLLDVECVHEPLGYLLDEHGTRDKPWCRVGDIESNLARRYSLVEIADALDPDKSLAWLDIVVPNLLASDAIDAMTKMRLAARWAEARA